MKHRNNIFLAVHDSSNTAQDPEVESVLSQWNNPDLIPNADNWTFDVFEFAKNSREGFLVKFAGYVLGITPISTPMMAYMYISYLRSSCSS